MHPGADEPFRAREVWPPGTIIKGDFSIEKRLGGGGFGTVYLAKHRFMGSTHVIKRLHDQYASDQEFVRKFFNEGRAVRRMKGCPHIVEVEHMTQSEDGYLILVMEYIAGGDLAGATKNKTLSVAEAVEYGRQIALGLEAAHKEGLIHRDIKPENVMMSRDSAGKPLLKLIDFGIAADHRNENHQTSVMRGGSVGYAAPEQWRQAGKDLDGRTDLYALGATLYKLLCGRLPFQEADSDVWTWLQRVEQGPPVAVASLRGDCPKALSELIQQMLAEKPEGRPASATEVALRLQNVLVPEVPQHKEHAQTIRIDDTRKATEVLSKPSKERKPAKWIGAGFALAAAIMAGVVFYPAKRDAVPDTGKTEPPPIVVVKETRKPPEPVVKEPEPTKPEIPTRAKPERPKPENAKQEKQKKDAVLRESAPVDPPKQPVVATVDHAALGDAARNSGDLKSAVQHYRQAGNSAKFASVQKAVEGDAEERVSTMMDRGKFAEGLQLTDSWLKEFPDSQRLQRLRVRIDRARTSQ